MMRGHWSKSERINWPEETKNMYVWIDYQSIPQIYDRPTKFGPDMDREATAAAIASLPSYIMRCKYMFILVPSITHDTRGAMNYRTWFSRGWCRFEMLCEYLNDTRTKLFVIGKYNSEKFVLKSVPKIAHLQFDVATLVGRGKFTCCERNEDHKNCDRASIRLVLERMIREKICRCFRSNAGKLIEARFHVVTKRFLTSSMMPSSESQKCLEDARNLTLKELKSNLLWRSGKDDELAKKTNWSLLKFSIIGCHEKCVMQLLKIRRKNYNYNPNSYKKFASSLLEPIKKKHQFKGFLEHSGTNLHLAMSFANPQIVAMLLEAGIPISVKVDKFMEKPLLYAIRFHNVTNIKYWCQRYPDSLYNANFFGASALTLACLMCTQNRKEIIDALLDSGAALDEKRHNDSNVFHALLSSQLTDSSLFLSICQKYRRRFGKTRLIKALNHVPCYKRFNVLNKSMSLISDFNFKKRVLQGNESPLPFLRL